VKQFFELCLSPPCRMLALFGHGAMSALSPLSVVKRKSDFWAVRSAFDPKATSAVRFECDSLTRQDGFGLRK
jgi:hypothetical protein